MLSWLKLSITGQLIHRFFIPAAAICTLTLTIDGDKSPVLLQGRGCIVDQNSKPKQGERIGMSTNDAYTVRLHKARREYE